VHDHLAHHNRILLSKKIFYDENKLAPNARILLPNKGNFAHVWDTIQFLGLKFPGEPIEYVAEHGKRFVVQYLLEV
jgi:hypothetical protein